MTLFNRLKTWCWHCGYHKNEWLSLKIFIERRGKCFYCRMDKLDEIYGPSQSATDWANNRSGKNRGKYLTPFPFSRYDCLKIIKKLKQLRNLGLGL